MRTLNNIARALGLVLLSCAFQGTTQAQPDVPKILFSCGLDDEASYEINFTRDEDRIVATLHVFADDSLIYFDNCKLSDFQTENAMTGHLYCVKNDDPNMKYAILLGETGFTQNFFARFTNLADPELGVACHATKEYIFDELYRYVQ